MIYLNGEWMPLEQGRVSVLDRGFIFGDGVYEVIPVYSRRPFRLGEHLRRLQYSLDGIKLANPHTDAEWTGLIGELIARNEGEDQYLYLQVTRGPAPRDHAFPKVVKPTVFLMSTPLATPDPALKASGVDPADVIGIGIDFTACTMMPTLADGTPLCRLPEWRGN
ncbi:MAG: aminotransferase class IV, partial [Burkholderiales bacterium]